ncbi:hypothetical protein ACWD3D_36795, partial [Streptomyces sp. NPDC002690]
DARLGGVQMHGAVLERVLVRGGKIDYLNLRGPASVRPAPAFAPHGGSPPSRQPLDLLSPALMSRSSTRSRAGR